jgi:Spy/CpxP family protein refolding chaperone
MMGEAIAEVTLRPDQEAQVELLSTQIEPLQAHVDQAENALLLALADQVEAGAIDRAALELEVEGYVATRRAVSPEIRRIVEDLHAILDPMQRADFSDALECAVHDVRRAILSGEQLDDLATKLGLDGAQIAAVQAGLASLQPSLEVERALLHQILEAFRGGAFSLEQVYPFLEVSTQAQGRAEQIIQLTAALLDVLTPEQRGPLAQQIREAASAPAAGPEMGAAAVPPQASPGTERTGTATQHLWVGAGVRRGRLGGVRRGVFVGGSARYAYRRVYAYPYAAAWGYGW